ncbi:putative pheophorbide a oxygenase [Helianthus anomalus]
MNSGEINTKTTSTVGFYLYVYTRLPVSPSNNKLIFIFRRIFAIWIDRFIPRWMYHISQNLVIGSDMYTSHVVNCSSCNGAYKGLNALKVVLQAFSGTAVVMELM